MKTQEKKVRLIQGKDDKGHPIVEEKAFVFDPDNLTAHKLYQLQKSVRRDRFEKLEKVVNPVDKFDYHFTPVDFDQSSWLDARLDASMEVAKILWGMTDDEFSKLATGELDPLMEVVNEYDPLGFVSEVEAFVEQKKKQKKMVNQIEKNLKELEKKLKPEESKKQ